MISGLICGFESIKLMLPTGLTPGAESAEYGGEKSGEVIPGTNNLTLGIGRGEYKGTCRLELQRFEYDKLNLFSAASGGFCNIPPVPVIVSCGNVGQPPAAGSLPVHFTKRGFKGAKGGASLNVPIEGALTAPIVRTAFRRSFRLCDF